MDKNLWRHVFSFLDLGEVQPLFQIKFFQPVHQHQLFWLNLFCRHFPEHVDMLTGISPDIITRWQDIRATFRDLWENGAFFVVFSWICTVWKPVFDLVGFFKSGVYSVAHDSVAHPCRVIYAGQKNDDDVLVTFRRARDLQKIPHTLNIFKAYCPTCAKNEFLSHHFCHGALSLVCSEGHSIDHTSLVNVFGCYSSNPSVDVGCACANVPPLATWKRTRQRWISTEYVNINFIPPYYQTPDDYIDFDTGYSPPDDLIIVGEPTSQGTATLFLCSQVPNCRDNLNDTRFLESNLDLTKL